MQIGSLAMEFYKSGFLDGQEYEYVDKKIGPIPLKYGIYGFFDVRITKKVMKDITSARSMLFRSFSVNLITSRILSKLNNRPQVPDTWMLPYMEFKVVRTTIALKMFCVYVYEYYDENRHFHHNIRVPGTRKSLIKTI